MVAKEPLPKHKTVSVKQSKGKNLSNKIGKSTKGGKKQVSKRLNFGTESVPMNNIESVESKIPEVANEQVTHKVVMDSDEVTDLNYGDGMRIIVNTNEFGLDMEDGEIGYDPENSDKECLAECQPQVNTKFDVQNCNSNKNISQVADVMPGCSSEQTNPKLGNVNQTNDGLTEEDYVKLVQDPTFNRVFSKLFKDHMGSNEVENLVKKVVVQEQQQESLVQPLQTSVKTQNDIQGTNSRTFVNEQHVEQQKSKSVNRHDPIKSHSDMTLYTPALHKLRECNAVDKISNFIEAVRLESEENGKQSPARLMRKVPQDASVIPSHDVAENKTRQSVIEAKKFKAKIAEPTGTSQILGSQADGFFQGLENHRMETEIQVVTDPSHDLEMVQLNRDQTVNQGISDDNFFHLTCHVDPMLISKIEKGEFVDLEKLLPKDKVGKCYSDDSSQLEWIHRDELTFLVPASERENKITSIQRWDQAFRVYATIYCGANPSRAKEIWQYVSVINTAAATYIWENVANYDFTFCHLMAFNPSRSWAKMYNQMWNLSMKDPIPKNYHNQRGTVSAGSSFVHKSSGSTFSSAVGNGNQQLQPKKKRSAYCWYFNRGEQCKYGKKCHFTEKCSYCDSSEHAVLSCPKLVGEKK